MLLNSESEINAIYPIFAKKLDFSIRLTDMMILIIYKYYKHITFFLDKKTWSVKKWVYALLS